MIRALIVMGPSGCGKSTLAAALAERLGYAFIEGDALHPEANRAKMAAGIALTDEDRAPFLDAVADALTSHAATGAVASCSALKRAYRERLARRIGQPLFVFLDLSRAALAQRMTHRPGHFMPLSLLDSQLATLEPPAADEPALRVDGEAPLGEQVDAVLAYLADQDRTATNMNSSA